jgi:hypothetical protein
VIDRASTPIRHQGRGLYALELAFDGPDENWEVIARKE